MHRPGCKDENPALSGAKKLATKCIGELAITAPGPTYPTRGATSAALEQL
ncbi:hypothetical protein PAMC26510_33265 [Caballeronia sordidicola]|uniref:Uncharacterized protein n=1 Tax=Caballeronia sordidicola TaxID=196367 RepID=A0A242M6C3_CABSO|nr:hypothetical protein PAMC26510_33265 [Caballeronia sordidicola]